MDPAKFQEMANYLKNLKMFPYFDAANYIVMCLMVRDDSQPNSGPGSLSRKHPLASWLSSMLMCFAGSILSNAIIGESLVAPFKNPNDLLLATAVWYVINYSPFDLAYTLTKFLPINLVISCMKQIQTVHKVHHGVSYALKNYPGAYIIASVIGVLKGAGYYYMRLFERLVRGVWNPTTHEILHPSFGSKACLAAAIVFILDAKSYIKFPSVVVYTAVVIFFVYFTVSAKLLGVHDPFVPFENLICTLFFGGLVDAVKQTIRPTPDSESQTSSGDSTPRSGEASTRGKNKGD